MFTPTLKTEKIPIPQGQLLRVYICGPTVYNSTHLGHARTYITFDIIRSLLEKVFNNRVVYQMNVTDVDDKIIRRSNELDMDFTALARKYEYEFFVDLENLNVRAPTFVTRVTEYMPEIEQFIQRIIDNGYAYCANGSVYFDTQVFSRDFQYPKLRAFDEAAAGYNNLIDTSKNQVDEKHHPSDFALWKAAKDNEPFWEAAFGRGRPGWHIECSVMAVHGLVNHFDGFDLHFGGRDLQFPHHANEIAQIEAYFGKDEVQSRFSGEVIKAFMHSGHLRIDSEIMSKSKMNFKTVSEVLQHYTAKQIRIFFLQVAYDADVNYSLPQLDAAIAIEQKITNFLQNSLLAIKSSAEQHAQLKKRDFYVLCEVQATAYKILDAYRAGFAYQAAFGTLMYFVDFAKQYLQEKPVLNVLKEARAFVVEQLAVMGLDYSQSTGSEDAALKVAQAAAEFRSEVKKAADMAHVLSECDRLRDKTLPALGFAIEDGETVIVKQINAEEWAIYQNRISREQEEKKQRAEEQRRAREEKTRQERELAAVKAEDMFRGSAEFYAFDEEGVPTQINGENGPEPIAKSRQKKLKKEWEARKKLNEKYAQ